MRGIFRGLFKKKRIGTNETQINVSQPRETYSPVDKPKHVTVPFLNVGCAQSIGMQRDHNEDALFILNSTLCNDHGLPLFGLFIIADGMGGHQHGEIASGLAIRSMASSVIQKLYLPLFALKQNHPEETLQQIMREGINAAHREILKDVPGGGTTMTAVQVFGGTMTIAHVGDSRAYMINPSGETHILTRDHSLVNRLVELGQITIDEAAIHPQRNVLYRALGQGEPFEPDITTSSIPKAGWLLICSDGLWGVVDESQISKIVTTISNPHQACENMVEAANQLGGPDNISAILVKFPEQ